MTAFTLTFQVSNCPCLDSKPTVGVSANSLWPECQLCADGVWVSVEISTNASAAIETGLTSSYPNTPISNDLACLTACTNCGIAIASRDSRGTMGKMLFK